MTYARPSRASCAAIEPTTPAAPCTRTLCPARRRPCSNSPCHAVRPGITTAAPAELVAESAEECAERGDLPPHCRPHPYPDQHGFRVVVAEKLARPVFSYPQWPRCKHPKTAARDFVKGSSKIQKLCAGSANIRARPGFHPRLYRFRNCEQGSILREVERPHPIALQKPRTAGLAWWSVCEH